MNSSSKIQTRGLRPEGSMLTKIYTLGYKINLRSNFLFYFNVNKIGTNFFLWVGFGLII